MEFLAALGLGGLATVAWPLWLHLRKERRQRVQVVPSIRLFDPRRMRRRRWRVREILLLVARVSLLAALFLLVSQPALESSRELPLPRLSQAEPPRSVLGILVDDSICSFAGETPSERLDIARAWLARQVGALPESVRVAVATTSHPRPTPLLSPETASALLSSLRVIPRPGSGAEALARLGRLIRERSGLLVVAAPRDGSLWQTASGAPPIDAPHRVHFLDTTDHATPVHVRRVDQRAGPRGEGQLRCALAGPEDALTGAALTVFDQRERKIVRRELTVAEALERTARIEASDLPAGGLRVTLGSSDGPRHPWSSYYTVITPRASRRASPRSVAVLFDPSPRGVLAAEILGTVIRALRPRLERHFVSTADEEAVAALPGAEIAVLITEGTLPPAARSWIERGLDAGLRLLCLPPGEAAGPHAAPEVPGGTRIPVWRIEQPLGRERVLPLKVLPQNLPDSHRFDEILLGELRGLEPRLVRPAIPDPSRRPVLSTDSGVEILSVRSAGPGSTVWSLHVPVELHDGSLVYHPIYPLLVEWILFPPSRSASRAGSTAEVGQCVDVASWFGRLDADATLVAPSGVKTPVRRGEAEGTWVAVAEAGIWSLRRDGGTDRRAANHVRAPGSKELERREWERLLRGAETVWLGPEDDLDADVGERLASGAPGEPSRRYDLSTLAAWGLLAAVGAEILLLTLAWRVVRSR